MMDLYVHTLETLDSTINNMSYFQLNLLRLTELIEFRYIICICCSLSFYSSKTDIFLSVSIVFPEILIKIIEFLAYFTTKHKRK